MIHSPIFRNIHAVCFPCIFGRSTFEPWGGGKRNMAWLFSRELKGNTLHTHSFFEIKYNLYKSRYADISVSVVHV